MLSGQRHRGLHLRIGTGQRPGADFGKRRRKIATIFPKALDILCPVFYNTQAVRVNLLL